jgi:hypothetical protein
MQQPLARVPALCADPGGYVTLPDTDESPARVGAARHHAVDREIGDRCVRRAYMPDNPLRQEYIGIVCEDIKVAAVVSERERLGPGPFTRPRTAIGICSCVISAAFLYR